MRCRACDAQLKSGEGKWNPMLHMHEELCRKCLRLAKLIEEPDNEVELTRPISVPREYK